MAGGRALVLLPGDIQHKNLWLVDLETGTEQQLTNLVPEFDVRDFDISPDSREVVLERVQEALRSTAAGPSSTMIRVQPSGASARYEYSIARLK
jgi:hypothetical protein